MAEAVAPNPAGPDSGAAAAPTSSVPAPVALSVVLPAFLEEENLRLLLPRLLKALAEIPVSSEVVVVDTPRPLDATAAVCRENGVRYVSRGPGDSFGDAVRSGIAAAAGEYLLFMDSDGSHNPDFVKTLWSHARGNDVVVASRYVEGGFTENNAALVLMSRVLNVTYRFVLGLKVLDVSNSFKVYRGDKLRGLKLKCQNFDIIEEILYKLSRKDPGLRTKEIPFTFRKRMFGKTKRNLLVFMFTYLGTMIRLRCSPVE